MGCEVGSKINSGLLRHCVNLLIVDIVDVNQGFRQLWALFLCSVCHRQGTSLLWRCGVHISDCECRSSRPSPVQIFCLSDQKRCGSKELKHTLSSWGVHEEQCDVNKDLFWTVNHPKLLYWVYFISSSLHCDSTSKANKSTIMTLSTEEARTCECSLLSSY